MALLRFWEVNASVLLRLPFKPRLLLNEAGLYPVAQAAAFDSHTIFVEKDVLVITCAGALC